MSRRRPLGRVPIRSSSRVYGEGVYPLRYAPYGEMAEWLKALPC